MILFSHLAKTLDLPVDDALRGAIAAAHHHAAAGRGAPFAAADTVKAVLVHRPDSELLALWLADAVLARRLGWPLPVPLLAAALLHPSLRTAGRRPHPANPGWTQACCAAYALAAAQACDLHAELGRRAENLLAAAPTAAGQRRMPASSKPCSTTMPCRHPAATDP